MACWIEIAIISDFGGLRSCLPHISIPIHIKNNGKEKPVGRPGLCMFPNTSLALTYGSQCARLYVVTFEVPSDFALQQRKVNKFDSGLEPTPGSLSPPLSERAARKYYPYRSLPFYTIHNCVENARHSHTIQAN